MFDWLRNWRKSDAEKQQEAITAYLDGALTGRERARFEAQMGQDNRLEAAVEAERQVKLLLRQMPRLRAPRNFVLDPAVYGKPQPVPSVRLYPRLRAATLIATLLFAVSLTLNLWTAGNLAAPAAPESVAVLSEPAPAEEAVEAPAAGEEVQAEIVTETTVEQFQAVPAEPEALIVEEEVAVEAEMAEEEGAAEEAGLAMEAAPPATMAAAADAAGEAAEPAEAPSAAEDMATDKALSPRPTATSMTARVATIAPSPTAERTPTAAAEISAAPAAGSAAEDQAESEAVGRLVEAPPINTIALIQIALGGLALVLLLATFIVRRRSR